MKKINYGLTFDSYKGSTYDNIPNTKAKGEKQPVRHCRLCTKKLSPAYYFYCQRCHTRMISPNNRGMD